MDTKERFFFLLTQGQISLMMAILAEYYFDSPEVRELLRVISSQVDTSLLGSDTIN